MRRLADKFGTTYKAINVWIFCVLVPAIIIGQAAIIIWLLCRRARAGRGYFQNSRTTRSHSSAMSW